MARKKERYAAVDDDKAMDTLRTSIPSLHCWQAD